MSLTKKMFGLLETLKIEHRYCEDPWYSCPKAEGGCADESMGDECQCGADEHNARVEEFREAMFHEIAHPERDEGGNLTWEASAHLHTQICRYQTERAIRAEERVAELEPDALRYRWLRDNWQDQGEWWWDRVAKDGLDLMVDSKNPRP